MTQLKDFPKLQAIDLGGTKITDSGLEYFKSLTRLTYLGLGETQITDTGLAHLKDLNQLRELNLYNTRVTDAGLEQSEGLEPTRDAGHWQNQDHGWWAGTPQRVEAPKWIFPDASSSEGEFMAPPRQDSR